MSDEIMHELGCIPTPIIGDCMDRVVGTYKLRAIHGPKPLVGRAHTVRVAPGDNLFIHYALNTASPGDVIVVEGQGDTQRALIGELMMLFAQSKGVAGFVIDGAIRDAAAFRQFDFPCFAVGQTLRGPYKNGPGATQVTVTIDGMVVHPGDFIVADEDGVIAIPSATAAQTLEAARKTLAKEEDIKLRIADGTTDRSWVENRIAAL